MIWRHFWTWLCLTNTPKLSESKYQAGFGMIISGQNTLIFMIPILYYIIPILKSCLLSILLGTVSSLCACNNKWGTLQRIWIEWFCWKQRPSMQFTLCYTHEIRNCSTYLAVMPVDIHLLQQHFHQRNNIVAVASFPLHLTKCIRQAVGQQKIR